MPRRWPNFRAPDADFVDELGSSLPATELVAEAAQSAASGNRPEVKLTGSTIRFLTDDVALEDGTSEVANPQSKAAPPSRGRFAAIWVKLDGKWRLASLRKARVVSPSTRAQLGELDWMTGQWSAKSGDATLEISANWNSTGTFLLREMKAVHNGEVVFRAAQRIGWDPLAHKIKSWIFDSDGGYGEGTWTKDGDSWVIHTTGVLADGRQMSTTNLVTYDGKDGLDWKAVAGRVHGEPVPDRDLHFTRQTPPEK